MTENSHDMQTRIVELLKKSSNILIALSGPDGDSIGAGCALALILKKLNKKATLIAPEIVSEEFKFLPAATEIKDELSNINNDLIIEVDTQKNKTASVRYQIKDEKLQIILSPLEGNLDEKNIIFKQGDIPYDLLVTVDTGDRHHLGKMHTEHANIFDRLTVINIDHHSSNSKFGDINYIISDAASTTEVIYPILEELQGNEDLVDADIATLLLAGLIADTGSFIHSNTSPSAFKLASKLLAKGARQQEIIKYFFKTKPLAMLKLWGATLNKLQFDPTYKLAWSSVTQDDLISCQAEPDHAEGIIDELLTNVPTTLIAMLLKEKEKGLISGSLRSTTDEVNVSDIAKIFNGGGHVRAAGFKYKYEGSFTDAEKEILDKIRTSLASQMKIPQHAQQSASEKIQKFSIEINGNRYDFSENDIKEMVVKFLSSKQENTQAPDNKSQNTNPNNIPNHSTSALKELKEGETLNLKKYYKFDN